ncbi:MAG TPA: acetylornithine deacetylase/succinyl-diaminopimelate desuccinylase family protein [Candidatus Saccharimonadales bacterium]|nr:acetylornithine deacetylase/succinyl-diaminopimelate desuccinylase family protein [Candidatus Saccharimonadales bacterium]
MTAAEAIRAAVTALRPECEAFLQELVRIPTVNPPGDRYEECARLVGDRLTSLGYAVQYVRPRAASLGPPRVNVVARLEGPDPHPTLHFNGHFDVVPAGDLAAWTHAPFGAELAGGRLWGRGTADQKAGIAASIFAVEAIRRAGIPLRGTVEQSATVDEETGGFAGVAELCDQGIISAERTDHVIITEPLDVDRVCIGHRGVYWCEITARGVVAHGSMPDLGRNAAVAIAKLATRIESELQPRLAARVTAVPVEPPEARHASISLNALHAGQPVGGDQSPVVPDLAVAVFDRRFIAEESSADVRREIETLVASEAAADPDIRWSVRELMLVEPTATPADGPVARAVRDAVRIVRGHDATVIASPGTYDQKHVVRRGGVTDCIAYGPGRLETAHRPDEYVDLDELADATVVMALATLALVG